MTSAAGEHDNSIHLLEVSAPPHLRTGDSVPSMMYWVAGALIPALSVGFILFGGRVLAVTAVCVAAALATEAVALLLMGRKVTLTNGSAVVTALLFVCMLPSSVPLWMAALGVAFGVGLAKMAFGGLGHNFVNPALAGRAFLMACYPGDFGPAAYPSPRAWFGNQAWAEVVDAMAGATPLRRFSEAVADVALVSTDFHDALPHLFWGDIGGCIGETSAAALLLGAAVLLYRRIIGTYVPAAFITCAFVAAWVLNGTGDLLTTEALTVTVYQLLSGGLLLGALFVANDPVTGPITPLGQVLFGSGCGILTIVIRRYGGHVEGVTYAILIMNCIAPLLDRVTRPRFYGERRRR